MGVAGSDLLLNDRRALPGGTGNNAGKESFLYDRGGVARGVDTDADLEWPVLMLPLRPLGERGLYGAMPSPSPSLADDSSPGTSSELGPAMLTPHDSGGIHVGLDVSPGSAGGTGPKL